MNKHLDAWDAIKNQEWFSIEGFRHVLSQMLSLQRVPDLDGPKYQIMKKMKTYEIRRFALARPPKPSHLPYDWCQSLWLAWAVQPYTSMH